jgi:hypothetical protein
MRATAVVLFALAGFSGMLHAEEREPFLRELSALLLANDGPVQADNGWSAIAIDHQAIPHFQREFLDYRQREGRQLEILGSIDVLDYPLNVTGGLVQRETTSLSLLWKDLLLRLEPIEDVPLPVDLPKLYRSPDRVEAARGGANPRTPLFEKYRAFRGEYDSLSLALVEEGGAWRLRTELSQFGSLREASNAVERDWEYFGGQLEIGSALRVKDLLTSSLIRAQERFEELDLRPQSRQPALKIWLSPPPDAWATMGSWLACRSRTFNGEGVVAFQLARVRVMRPWFMIDDVIDGRLRPSEDWSSRNPDYVFSAGGTPSLMETPTGGKANAYIDEIILVRNIAYDARGRDPAHPLSWAYSDINLLGYVLRVLPRIASK